MSSCQELFLVSSFLKELSQNTLSYFGYVQNYLSIEGNMKIVVYQDRKHQRDNNKP